MRLFHYVWAGFALFFLLLGWAGPVLGTEIGIFTGKVLDIHGVPVAGAQVYVFDNKNVKRPADFISQITALDGVFSLQLPAGEYWATAVFRVTKAAYGPLAVGDKHSGEPINFSLTAAMVKSIDFTVRNLREAALLNQKKNGDLFKLSGRIVDLDRKPVAMAYVMAARKKHLLGLPPYISTWTDSSGAFTIYLPGGKFYLGVATDFPPDNDYYLHLNVNLDRDISDLEIISKDRK